MHKVLEEQCCNLCGKALTKPLYEKAGLKIIRCRNCGLVYVNPRPAKSEILMLASKKGEEVQTSELTLNYDYSRERKDEYIAKLLKIEKYSGLRGKLLDIGCSSGAFLCTARELGWIVKGLEIAHPSARYAKEVRGLDVFAGELTTAGYPDEYFDAITMWEVLEHLPDPQAYIREINRILKRRGVFALSVPNFNSITRRLIKEKWWIMGPEEHLYYFTPASLRKVLGEAGFEIIKLHSQDFDPFYLVANLKANSTIDYDETLLNKKKSLKEKTRESAFWKSVKNICNIGLDLLNLGNKMFVYARKV